MSGYDHLVTAADTTGAQCDREGVEAVSDADRFARAAIGREIGLKRFDLLAEYKPTRTHDLV